MLAAAVYIGNRLISSFVHLLYLLGAALCCTCIFSYNIRRRYVARVPCLATFEGIMLHVLPVSQYSRVLCCTCIFSCNIRGYYVARAPSLATFGGTMLHVLLVLQHSGVLCCTWTSSCNIRGCYVARAPRLATLYHIY